MANRTRTPRGKFARGVPEAEAIRRAAELRSEKRWTYERIAREMGCAVSTAHLRVQQGIAAIPAEAGEEVRRQELAQLDMLARAAIDVLERRHVTVSHGKVVYVDDAPLEDDEPVLRAVASLLRVQERRARLLGLDAPSRSEVTVHDGDSELDREIERLLAGMGPVEQGKAPVATGSKAQPAHP